MSRTPVEPSPNYSLSRMTRGEQIVREKTILEMANGAFSVPSQTVDEIAYLVRLIDGKYVCNCIDFKFRQSKIPDGLCKHGHAVKLWIAAQVEIKQAPKPKIFADDSTQCDKCGSIRVIRYGIRANKQAYLCKDCKHKFTPSLLKKAKYSPETVSLCLDLYFSGDSLAKVAKILNRQFEMKIGKATVYRWIQKYVPLISEYVNKFNPQLSDTWHADEVFVKHKEGYTFKTGRRQQYDNTAILWNIMDRQTRFLLASKVSKYRDEAGAIQAFTEAIKNAHGNKPDKVFTDSHRAYHTPIFDLMPQTWHVAKSGINKPHANNNRIERLNGTIRERTKVTRAWKSLKSSIPEGQRIHYNFIRPHQALEGQTPAQRAGINAGENNWLNLLRNTLSK